ncbi:unnamed protein product [Trypanosoma congolense IL3000]|uniref:WGS project CAEQ00000000 data, annotated contig 859 n=1 Tax=Trypanosoma congolense (strain IL3000) TaxID=1068625 RepID=F9WJ08_TRYCI|nr:unnamed protein product [Trypanosoma congolense IL3000]
MVVLMNALMRCFAGLFGRSFFPFLSFFSFLFFLKISIHTIFRVYCSSIFVRDVAFTACLSNPNSFFICFFLFCYSLAAYFCHLLNEQREGSGEGGVGGVIPAVHQRFYTVLYFTHLCAIAHEQWQQPYVCVGHKNTFSATCVTCARTVYFYTNIYMYLYFLALKRDLLITVH